MWPTMYPDRWRNNVVGGMFLISAVLFIATVIFMGLATTTRSMGAKCLLILWAVAPPVWFLFEHFFIWKPKPDFPEFKHGQEPSRNIWLAFVGVILALYFK